METSHTRDTGNRAILVALCILSVTIVGCSSSEIKEVDPGTGRGTSLPEPSPGSPATAWSDSLEYRQSNGLALIKAAEGYAVRETGSPGGKGKKVAVLDTEADFNHRELSGRRFRFSDDTEGTERHGTHVAGTVGALRDGKGVHGVAYNAELIGIAVLREKDITRVGLLLDPVAENATDVAAGIASAAGVKEEYFPRDPVTGIPSLEPKESNPKAESDILNLSLGGPDPHEQIKDALKIAAGRGKIIIVSLGNDGLVSPDKSPALYVTESGIRGYAIAVGALNSRGDGKASFSNACGQVRDYCLFAPGTNIYSTLPGNRYGSLSGTSMAAPHVSGAAAVVWAAFPNKNAAQIVRRLLDTADPVSALGRNRVLFGHGKLNLAAALSPEGFLSVATAQGNVMPVTSSAVDLPPGFHVPSGTTSLTNAVTYDQQRFPFYYDLTSIIREAPSQASDSALEDFLANLGQSVFLPVGARTSIEVMSADDTPVPHRYAHSDPVALDTGSEHDGEEGFRVHFAPLPELSVVVGQGAEAVGLSNAAILERTRRGILQDNRSVAPFAGLVGKGTSMSLAWQASGSTTIDFAGKYGDSYFGAGSTQLMSLGLTRQINDRFATSARFGQLEENDSLLGIRGTGAFDGLSGATTSFVDLGVSANASNDLVLFGSLSQGLTGDRGDRRARGIVSSWSEIRSGSFAMGGELRDIWGDDRLTLTASQPFRPRNVRVRMEVPSEEVADGVVRYVDETVDLAPDGRETQMQLMYQRDGGERGRMSFAGGAYARMDANHDESADTEYGVGIKLGLKF